MSVRTFLTVLGSALATLFLVTGATVQAVSMLSPDGIAGELVAGGGTMVGLLFGVVAGLAVGSVVEQSFEDWSRAARRVLSGYGAFGLVFSFLFVLSLMAPDSIQQYLVIEVLVGASLFAFAVVHGLYYTRDVSQQADKTVE